MYTAFNSNANTIMLAPSMNEQKQYFYSGLLLAILSTLLIGTGFILKKRALLRSGARGFRARDGRIEYLRDFEWWIGLFLFGLGEGANFVAYALAPTVLVTPLGGLSILVCAVLGARFLKERLNLLGKLGCLICVFGSALLVMHAPKEQTVNSLQELYVKFFSRDFMLYAFSVILMSTLLIFVGGPRFGKKNPFVFTAISGSLGSLSVMACKGIGIGIREGLHNDLLSTLKSGFLWFLLCSLVISVTVQLYYLNRALDSFNTGLITALLYVLFTGFVLLASAILFQEFNSLSLMDYVELAISLLLIVSGIFLMTVMKEINVTWSVSPHSNSSPQSTTDNTRQRSNDPNQEVYADSEANNFLWGSSKASNVNEDKICLLSSFESHLSTPDIS